MKSPHPIPPSMSRRWPRPLFALLAVFFILAIVYSVVVPIFEGPDEDDHFRYVKYLADQHSLPVQLFQTGGGAAGHQGWQPPLYYGLAALVISPVDTSDFEQHLWRNPAASYQGDRTCCGRNLYFHTPNEDFPYHGTTLAVHLARAVSIIFGALTVSLIYFLVLTVFPDAPWLALSAAALAAFNPSFIFASMLVSNDAPLAAFCTLALLLGVRLIVGKTMPTMTNFAFMGLAIALGLLVKTTALGLIPFALAVGMFLASREKKWSILWNAVIGVHVPVVLLTGWWFIRNQLVYGDPLAYRLMSVSAIFPREQPLTWAELFQISLPWLWQTFWGGPTPGDFPSALLILFGVLTLIATIGTALYFLRERDLNMRIALLWLAGWLGFIFVAQIQFMRTSGGTDQGRYLFPALGVFTLLFVLGLRTLWRLLVERIRNSKFVIRNSLTHSLPSLLFFALALYVLLANTIPAYARPAPVNVTALNVAQKELNYNFGNQLVLHGYQLSSRSVRRGDSLDVTLYWTAAQGMKESFRVFVHLVDEQGHVAGGKDVIPGGGAYSTVLWQPGEWVRDTVTITTGRDAIPGNYQVEVGIYPFGKPEDRVDLVNSDEDRVLLDGVYVSP